MSTRGPTQVNDVSESKFYSESYLENSDDVLRELHKSCTRDPSVDSVHEDPRPDGVRHRAKLGLLVGLPLGCSQLPSEG